MSPLWARGLNVSSCAETDQLAVGTVTSLQVQEPHGEVIRVTWVGVQGATAYRVTWRRVDGRTLTHGPDTEHVDASQAVHRH